MRVDQFSQYNSSHAPSLDTYTANDEYPSMPRNYFSFVFLYLLPLLCQYSQSLCTGSGLSNTVGSSTTAAIYIEVKHCGCWNHNGMCA
jgi:hypothetical protein